MAGTIRRCVIILSNYNTQQQMTQAMKSEGANALDEVRGLNQEFSFAARMLKGSLAKGCKKK